jgi:DNA-binding MarR family transcriptional regulator
MAHGNDPSVALRARVQTFVRSFGLLRDAETPCGQPLQLSHAHALSVLLERRAASAGTRQKDLAEALGLDKSSVARLCRRMEQAGHVVQARDEDDGRARALTLTPKGARVAREVDAASRARFERVLAAMPRTERGRVLNALTVLNAAVMTLEDEE